MYFDFALFIIINLYIFARGARKLFPRHMENIKSLDPLL